MKNIKLLLSSIIILNIITACNTSIPGISTNSVININSYTKSDYETFIKKHSYKLDSQSIKNISALVSYYSKIHDVEPSLVLSLIARESSFRADVVSSSGAVGLGQLMPGTAGDMGVLDRYNTEQNIMGTVKYISWLLKRTKGDVDIALASYNMGPGAVESYLKQGKDLPSGVKRYVSDIKVFQETIS